MCSIWLVQGYIYDPDEKDTAANELDTAQTVTEIRKRNAARNAYCK